MAQFIQILPSPLTKGNTSLTGDKPKAVDSSNTSPYDHVRRPVRGLQIKDETFGTLEVKTADGKNILLIDSGGKVDEGNISYSSRYSNFLLQSVSESSMEKMQIVETFGPSFAFFFGTRPKTLTVNGILLNSSDFNWKNEFWHNYETYLRGTKLVSNDTIAYLSYDDVTVTGFLISMNAEQSSDPQEFVSFNFQMLVSSVVPTNIVGYNQFPYSKPVNVEPEVITLKASEAPNPQDGNKSGTWTGILEKALRGDLDMSFLYGERAQGYTNFANQFLTGANMRTPIGYEGVILYDGEPVKYRYGTTTPTGTYSKVSYGKIRDNTDEYIAMNKSNNGSNTVYLNAEDSLKAQYNASKSIQDSAKEQFKKYGVNPDPPSEVSRLIRVGAFSTFQLAGRLTIPQMAFPEQNANENINASTISSFFQRINR